jgi:hypothetical protein
MCGSCLRTGLAPSMPHRLRDEVAARARNRCEYCLAPEVVFNSLFEVDHIVPLARSGADEDWNLALACGSCNRSKYVATSAVDPTGQQVVRLFNPRADAWSDHFERDVRTAEIFGLTDIGRATVLRLRMNGPEQIGARRLWVFLFSFPNDPPSVPELGTEEQ